ncbi:TPA-induced transmembrane protein homolog isoform X2 [Stegastes partitus]|uniref:TPA-induced transmembrane protein homolog isoform X2 n=1 Tax=Stegastes partitus TaxID=144197 RepID=A0A9Y4KFF1_9TELE|nr:PREDICTED: TPA-induced transmembrane protein isoform X2 [Stegastes partitus]
MDIQLQVIDDGAAHDANGRINGGNGEAMPVAAQGQRDVGNTTEVTSGNGEGVANGNPEATETDAFVIQINGGNGEAIPFDHAAEGQTTAGNANPPQEGSVCRIKKELNQPVCEKVKQIRLWMVIIFIFVLMALVIVVSMAVCSAVHEDEDDQFDSSLFKVPHYFNGSFQLPNQLFKEELLNLHSSESQELAAELQIKMADLYRSSPALGRYFSKAEVLAFRNGSVTADYKLTFVLPEEQQDQLRNFTLSREMVYNVFRQFLYDQEPVESAESGPMFIDPVSLKMFSGH